MNKRYNIYIWTICLVICTRLLTISPSVIAASFDCSKAGSKIEKTVCRNQLGQAWRDYFYKYPSAQKINAPIGFVLKSSPNLQAADTLKTVNSFTVLDVVGHLETDEGRFYISVWSWEQRALKGKRPNWIWINGNNTNKPNRIIVGNKLFITNISFMNPSAGMPIESNISNAINQAVQAGVQLAQQNMPHLQLNAPRHKIDNSIDNVNDFINLFYDFNLTKSQKIEAIIQQIMIPNGVDVILSGQYLEKAGGTIHIRPLLLSKTNRRIITRGMIFQDKKFLCSYNVLCRGAHDQIRDAVRELLGNL